MHMNDLQANIIDFLKDINYFGWQQNVKIIFLILTFIFLFIAVYAYIKAHGIMRKHREHMLHEHAHSAQGHGGDHGGSHGGHSDASEHHASTQDKELLDQWARIQQFVGSVREAEWKLAVIEADKYVDDALKQHGFAGESMGERLMLIKPDQLTSLQDLWDAHKLRNLLVHEAGYKITHEQATAAIHAFEKVLRELGVLQ